MDYLSLSCGKEAVRGFARTTAYFHWICIENLTTVTLEFVDKIVGSLAIGRIGNGSHTDIGEIKFHVLGSDGALAISEGWPEVSIHYLDHPGTEFKSQRLPAEDNVYLLADNVLRAIDEDSPSILGVRTSRNISATVAAAIESERSGTFVEVIQKCGAKAGYEIQDRRIGSHRFYRRSLSGGNQRVP